YLNNHMSQTFLKSVGGTDQGAPDVVDTCCRSSLSPSPDREACGYDGHRILRRGLRHSVRYEPLGRIEDSGSSEYAHVFRHAQGSPRGHLLPGVTGGSMWVLGVGSSWAPWLLFRNAGLAQTGIEVRFGLLHVIRVTRISL